MLVNPAGVVKAGPLLNEEGLLTAEFHRDERRAVKAYFDAMGHYSRWDAVNLELNDVSYAPVHDHHRGGRIEGDRVRRVDDGLGQPVAEPAELEAIADQYELAYETVEAVAESLSD